MNYYNDNDERCCAWLRELIAAGLIPAGEVDDRSICDVKPAEVRGYSQCHWFAGIGGWPYALKLAGWPKDRAVWTGSCPCQPLSCAGLGKGHADERHLWPAFYRLISECGPPIIFGEQVASKLGREWLAGVRTDLENVGYACGCADLCAASVGAPHIRQRLYWVAQSNCYGRREGRPSMSKQASGTAFTHYGEPTSGLANAPSGGQRTDGSTPEQPRHAEQCEQSGGMGDATDNGFSTTYGRTPTTQPSEQESQCVGQSKGASRVLGFWSTAIWHQCRDGKARRISPEPALFPLAPGLPGRVGILRGAGNAIVPPLAAQFIKAVMEIYG